MSKVKAVVTAVVTALAAPDLRPSEIRIGRALVLALLGALGVKYGVKAA